MTCELTNCDVTEQRPKRVIQSETMVPSGLGNQTEGLAPLRGHVKWLAPNFGLDGIGDETLLVRLVVQGLMLGC